MTTPRTPAEPISSCTVRSWPFSLVESHSHWDTLWQQPQSLPDPDQFSSPVHQEQKAHLSSSRTSQSKINHATVTSDTTWTTNGKVSVTTQSTTSAHSYTQDYLTRAHALNSTASETNRGDALTSR